MSLPDEYEISTMANLSKGFAIVDESALPKEVRVQLIDKSNKIGRRRPSITIVFRIRDGQLGVHSLFATEAPGSRSVRSGDLRELDLEALQRQVYESVTLEYSRDSDLLSLPTERKRGRRAISNVADSGREPTRAELMAVASVYCNPANQGNRVRAVMLELGYGSIPTANRRIKEARELGWIPPTGSSSVELGSRFDLIQPQLEVLLEERDADA